MSTSDALVCELRLTEGETILKDQSRRAPVLRKWGL